MLLQPFLDSLGLQCFLEVSMVNLYYHAWKLFFDLSFYVQVLEKLIWSAKFKPTFRNPRNDGCNACMYNVLWGRRLKHTNLFPISRNGCFLVQQSSFISRGFSIREFWSSIAPSEVKLLVFSVSTDPNSLLVHLDAAQPQEVPQLPPETRHSHFEVLHNDFLLQEQHTPDAGFTIATPENSDSEVSVSSKLVLLPTDAEDWARPTWSADN